ncbi:fungal-specific transcription factor [Boeremia exigua]|uniref:fungal-specific transcription factor n=1 Tax=Boeremia exigua TaxID=749465 RepID=UPI001E8EB330|nr:fungal-specific transcription factor [Boeremia exigua]KAH6632930.1 fungal-specific transcription factor [Boeremia exigua]
MTSSPTPSVSAADNRVRKRVSAACAFCRRRKIKCSAERPSCAACKTYTRVCSYEDAQHVPRPARVRPPKSSGHVVSSFTPNSASAFTPVGSEHLRHHGIADHSLSAPRLGTENGFSSYRARMSTLFDEHAHHDRSAVEARSKMPEQWIENGLVAEATRQRQLEGFNLQRGTLDFDGLDPDLGMHLLNLHWNRQHHSFLVTYRPAFMRDMACAGPYFSKLLLNAIYFGASKFSPRHEEVRSVATDVRTAGWQFRNRFRQLLGDALDKSEITTIQALLVMTNSLFALGDERSAAWTYAGIAFRMIVDLGLHVDTSDIASTSSHSDQDCEVRRRVFWSAFVIDKIQSLYQGRPVSIRESDALVPLKFLDTYEELEHWSPFAYNIDSYPGSPSFSVSTFKQLCLLSIILSDIIGNIYTESRPNADLTTKLHSIHQTLVSWRDNLPDHLTFTPTKTSFTPPPHVMKLHALYNVLLVLLHRPFVTDAHLLNIPRTISVGSLKTCATAANDIVDLMRAYDKAFGVRGAPYLISYAAYVAATIHARIAANSSADSHAHNNLVACLCVLHDNQQANRAVRRANAVIQDLLKRMGLEVPNLDKTASYKSADIEQQESLQTPDVDGILEKFTRVHVSAQKSQPAADTRDSTEVATAVPAQTNGEVSGADADGPVDVPMQDAHHEGLQKQAQQAAADPNVADDILYGLNGPALDNFAFLDWEAL